MGPQDLEERHFAIVGAGYTGIYLFCKLVERLIKKSKYGFRYKITLFEKKRSHLATGLPYQINAPAIWTLNSSTEGIRLMPDLMTVDAWIKKAGFDKKNYFLNSGDGYIPRALFGKYLKYCYKNYKKKATDHKIEIEERFEEIVDANLLKCHQWRLISHKNNRYSVDFLFLCLGHTPSRNYKHLEGKTNFFRPIFDIEPLKKIPKNSTVYILGGQATFVDIALWLNYVKHHKGKIHHITRNPHFITSKGNSDGCDPRAIDALMITLKSNYKNDSIKLPEAKSLFLNTYKKSVKNPVDLHHLPSTPEALSYQLTKYKGGAVRHDHIGNIDEMRSFITCFIYSGCYDAFVRKLSKKAKLEFQKEIHSLIFTCLIGITPLNAQLLLDMYKKNKIVPHHGVTSIAYDEKRGVFKIHFADGNEIKSKYLIDASGLGCYVEDFKEEFSVIKNLMIKGYAIKNKNGFIKLNSASQLINNENKAQDNLFFLGPMAPEYNPFPYPFVQQTVTRKVDKSLSALFF